MAKYIASLSGDMEKFLQYFEKALARENVSATLEDSCRHRQGEFRCVLRVYERYSFWSRGRVSLSLLLAGGPEKFVLTAITAGGSSARFWKINTLGEEGFLGTVKKIVREYNCQLKSEN